MNFEFDVLAQSERVHIANKKWWHDLEGNPIVRNKGEQLMLVISEISEAMEGARKNKMDDHLPHRKMEEVEIADALIRMLDYRYGHGNKEPSTIRALNFEPVENVGQTLISICSGITTMWHAAFVDDRDTEMVYCDWFIDTCFVYAKARDLDILGAYEEKMAYNAVRADHQLENRKAKDGKKW